MQKYLNTYLYCFQNNILLITDSLTLHNTLSQQTVGQLTQNFGSTGSYELWKQKANRDKTFAGNNHMEEVTHACQSNAIATAKYILPLCFSFSNRSLLNLFAFFFLLANRVGQEQYSLFLFQCGCLFKAGTAAC